MSQKRRPDLANLPHRLREALANLPDRWREWREGLRQDPTLLWRGPVVRIGALVLLGAVLILGINWLVAAFSPGGSKLPGRDKAVQRAILYVGCTNPACRVSYTTEQPLNFKAWPLKCEKCGGATVYRATPCPVCRRWFAVAPGGRPDCPFCAEQKAGEHSKQPTPGYKPRSDDNEDPW